VSTHRREAEIPIGPEEAVRPNSGSILGGNPPRMIFIRQEAHDIDMAAIESSEP
jgi:hypothetical protein